MTELDTVKRARGYMDMLARGIDPISGQAVPGDSVLNQARLGRCFSYVAGILDKVIANGGQVGAVEKVEFAITPEQLARVEILPRPVRITEFADNLQKVVDNPGGMKKLNVLRVSKWLIAQGILCKELGPDGKNRNVPTREGLRLGVSAQLRQSQDGDYLAVYYDPNAQRFLLDHLYAILQT